jgi:hypothetical protein
MQRLDFGLVKNVAVAPQCQTALDETLRGVGGDRAIAIE